MLLKIAPEQLAARVCTLLGCTLYFYLPGRSVRGRAPLLSLSLSDSEAFSRRVSRRRLMGGCDYYILFVSCFFHGVYVLHFNFVSPRARVTELRKKKKIPQIKK